MATTQYDLPVKTFKTAQLFETWLSKNAGRKGVLLRLYKKGSGKPSITIAEALDVALCYGWLDGQRNKYDEESYLQRFTPSGQKASGPKGILISSAGW